MGTTSARLLGHAVASRPALVYCSVSAYGQTAVQVDGSDNTVAVHGSEDADEDHAAVAVVNGDNNDVVVFGSVSDMARGGGTSTGVLETVCGPGRA